MLEYSPIFAFRPISDIYRDGFADQFFFSVSKGIEIGVAGCTLGRAMSAPVCFVARKSQGIGRAHAPVWRPGVNRFVFRRGFFRFLWFAHCVTLLSSGENIEI
jgi:hypothetical protein